MDGPHANSRDARICIRTCGTLGFSRPSNSGIGQCILEIPPTLYSGNWLVMIVSGVYVAINSFRAKNTQSDGDGKFGLTKSAGYFAVLGAALSPDLSILPICLVAVPLGLITVVHTIVIFAASSILTDLLLVLSFSVLFSRAVEKLPSKYNDALVGLVIAVVGVYVLIFG